MARNPRFEHANGCHHLLNRGNYRAPIFADDGTKQAFLKCLAETCVKTAWRIFGWCVMTTHFHFAPQTPQPNLIQGMTWLQGTFAARFNRFREERGHLFQGRYKSICVDPETRLGALCHYIHLNPVRARMIEVEQLADYPWTSVCWMMHPEMRPSWYEPKVALAHAGGLPDTPGGHREYLAYLRWLAENKQAQKDLHFDQMERGPVIGSAEFLQEMIREFAWTTSESPLFGADVQAANEALWSTALTEFLRVLSKTPRDLETSGKSETWKLGIAAMMKTHTTATNRWLSVHLNLGNLHEVSRKVSAWAKDPDLELLQKLGTTTPCPKT